MSDPDKASSDLNRTVIRICLACGVVNPAGPSEACPHVQVARFDGVDGALERALADVAEARQRYSGVLADLLARVKLSIRDGTAEVVAAQSTRPADIEKLDRAHPSRPSTLELAPPAPPAVVKRVRGHRKAALAVDSRQLDLLLRGAPKGEA
ncbi:MAG: hypothetical protein PHU25_20985 [Deltaproteobacteria bacterium]|nr:hypothetical protein [Deltaproteobacteria bacterium]